MPPDRDQGDELLASGGWSRRTGALIAVAVLVVAAGLIVGLTRGGHHSSSAQHSAGPSAPESVSASGAAPAVTGNDLLYQGLSSSVGTVPTARHGIVLVASAELLSRADRTYSILYPLAVDGISKAMSVADVELTAERSSEIWRLLPKALSTIRPTEHLEVWMKLRIACGDRKVTFRRATVSIALAGTSEPAVFSFADLFGSELATRQRSC